MSENNFDFKIIEKNSFSGGRVYSENKDGFVRVTRAEFKNMTRKEQKKYLKRRRN